MPTDVTVTVTRAIERELVDFDDFVGRTEASMSVDVRSRVSGFIESVDFYDGAIVTEGQVLYRIQREEYDAVHKQSLARLEVAEARSELARTKLDRSRQLFEVAAISKEELDENAAAYTTAQAEIASAKADADRTALDVKYTEVLAPIGGKIDRTLVDRGDLVTGGLGSGTMLTRIVKNDPMYAYVQVDERALLRYVRMIEAMGLEISSLPELRERQPPCLVQLSDEKKFPTQAFLDFAENQLDAGTGTVRIRAVIRNEAERFAAGMFVRVRIPMSPSYTAVLVPETAIGTELTQKYVFVVDDAGKVSRRNVTVGSRRGEARVILDGIKAGERVIVRGLQRVRNDATVKYEGEEPFDVPSSLLTGDLPRSRLSDLIPSGSGNGNAVPEASGAESSTGG